MGYVIAARKSDLARLQAYLVGDALKKEFPDKELQYHFRESLGDQNLNDPLWKMPEKGVFTEDFRQGLLNGEFDMVVHSWKDLPVEDRPGSKIVATLPRADMRDLLLFKKSSWERVKKKGKIKIFTSSPRRIYNLENFFKDCLPAPIFDVQFESVRGNIPTRLNKLFDNEDIDGLVLAKAAWDRLFLSTQEEFAPVRETLQQALAKCRWMVLPLRMNPNAAAQGAIAIEVADSRPDLVKELQKINCPETFAAVTREREILKSYGGGCHQKIGVSVITRPYGTMTFLRGETDSGEKLRREELDTFNTEEFSVEESYPYKASDSRWFNREQLEFKLPGPSHHFIARANALPVRKNFSDEEIVWVSGNRSWKKLASRGVWVCGSTEGLGETEDFRVEALAPNLPWVKWTHSQGHSSDKFNSIATYELRPRRDLPDIRGKKNFFWRSGSSFLAAVKAFPEIVNGSHFCGPGSTYDIILDYFLQNKVKGHIKIAIDFKHWSKKTWRGDN